MTTMYWARLMEQRQESTLTVDEQLDLIRRDQAELEKRVRLVEDLLAAIRFDDDDEMPGARR